MFRTKYVHLNFTHRHSVSHENYEDNEQNDKECQHNVPFVSPPNQNGKHFPGVGKPVE